VRVTRGSLEGVEGVLVRKKSLYRLVLSVDMLAQSVAVEIDASDVEPVPTLAKAPVLQVARAACVDGLATRDQRRMIADFAN
jgi:hypothetical protein